VLEQGPEGVERELSELVEVDVQLVGDAVDDVAERGAGVAGKEQVNGAWIDFRLRPEA
jgi:hypothetical protein